MMENTSFGPRYLYTNPGRRQVDAYWTIRRLPRGGWLVVEARTGKQLEVFPTKEVALYVVSRMNGQEELSNSVIGEVL